MPKLKPKKTLKKRVKITKKGKVVAQQSSTGHLKRKWTADKKHRKTDTKKVKGAHKNKFKKMLGK